MLISTKAAYPPAWTPSFLAAPLWVTKALTCFPLAARELKLFGWRPKVTLSGINLDAMGGIFPIGQTFVTCYSGNVLSNAET